MSGQKILRKNSLEISFEWETPSVMQGEELRATLCRLKLLAKRDGIELPISRIYRHSSQTVSDSILIPSYPLAEWILENWWYLFHESQKKSSEGFLERHDIYFGREGYAFPHLTCIPSGDEVCLTWSPSQQDGSAFEFLARDSVFVPRKQVEEMLLNFVEKTANRLLDCGIADSGLQRSLNDHFALSVEEIDFCETVAAYGEDPFSVSEEFSKFVSELDQLFGKAVSVEFGSAVNPLQCQADFSQLQMVIDRLGIQSASNARTSRLPIINGKTPHKQQSGDFPWTVGYKHARNLRQTLGIDDLPFDSYQSVVSVFESKNVKIDSYIRFESDLPSSIRGVVGTDGKNNRLAAITKPKVGPNESFQSCRAIYPLLTGFNGLSLITNAETGHQKQNRAFAAEFLMPASFLRKEIKDPMIGFDRIQDLAEEFNVSTEVVRLQIENHRIARIEQSNYF